MNCADGYWSESGINSSCIDCGVGFYCKDGSKLPCPAGTWSNSTTASQCIQCVAGKYSTLVGQTNNTCLNCADGYWSAAGLGVTCANQPCGTGYYCTGGNRVACVAGKFSTATTASSSSTCINCLADTTINSVIDLGPSNMSPWGLSFIDTQARWIWNVNNPAPPSIIIKFQKTFTSPTSAAGVLYVNTDNEALIYFNGELVGHSTDWQVSTSSTITINQGENTVSIDAWNACCGPNTAGLIAAILISGATTPLTHTDSTWTWTLGGTWSNSNSSTCSIDLCDQGYFCSGNGVKQACPAGRYSGGKGLTSNLQCLQCPSGKYSTVQGATSKSVCMNCADGYWSESGRNSSCTTTCDDGYYCTGGIKTACPVGTWVTAGLGTSLSSCTVANCGTGFFCDGVGVRVDCPAGGCTANTKVCTVNGGTGCCSKCSSSPCDMIFSSSVTSIGNYSNIIIISLSLFLTI
jgi:hypothetical protein